MALRELSSITICEDDKDSNIKMMDYAKERDFGLYLVNITKSMKCKDDQKLIPLTVTHYVMAESEEGAISQVNSATFASSGEYYESASRGEVTATAIRLPLIIRGWGRRVF